MTNYFTCTGDAGESGIQFQRLQKTDPVFAAIGCVDELNASLGVALAFVEDLPVKEVLVSTQNVLFTVGAELAGAAKVRITEQHVTDVETAVHNFSQGLKEQTTFLLPQGTKSAAFLHLARTICRRAERSARVLHETKPVNNELLRYLNRLSSLLFVLARYENRNSNEVAPKY